MNCFEIREFEKIYNDLFFVEVNRERNGITIRRLADALRANRGLLQASFAQRWFPIFIGSAAQCEVALKNYTKLTREYGENE